MSSSFLTSKGLPYHHRRPVIVQAHLLPVLKGKIGATNQKVIVVRMIIIADLVTRKSDSYVLLIYYQFRLCKRI